MYDFAGLIGAFFGGLIWCYPVSKLVRLILQKLKWPNSAVVVATHLISVLFIMLLLGIIGTFSVLNIVYYLPGVLVLAYLDTLRSRSNSRILKFIHHPGFKWPVGILFTPIFTSILVSLFSAFLYGGSTVPAALYLIAFILALPYTYLIVRKRSRNKRLPSNLTEHEIHV